MKKRIIIPTALVGIIGGFALTQTTLFSSAEESSLITASEAKEIALKQFDGTITEFDYDRDEYTPHYDFEMKGAEEKVEVVVDAATGNARITERETLRAAGNAVTNAIETVETTVEQAVANTQAAIQDVVPQPVAPIATDFISKAEAIAIAQQHASGTVVKAELDDDDAAYEVEIKDGQTQYEFDIDARTGEIISSETDIED